MDSLIWLFDSRVVESMTLSVSLSFGVFGGSEASIVVLTLKLYIHTMSITMLDPRWQAMSELLKHIGKANSDNLIEIVTL